MPRPEPVAARAPGDHCDPDVLVLRAIGERAGVDADDEHLRTCARCQGTLDELTAVAAAARALTPQDRPVPPPAAVWDGITGELGLRGPIGSSGRPARFGTGAGADVRALRPRWRSWALVAAAAAFGAVVGGVTVAQWPTGPADRPAPLDTPTLVASAVLAPLSGSQARGTAVVEQVGADEVVQVDVTGLPRTGDGFYEVWLLDPVAGRMVALGSLGASERGTFVVPPGVPLDAFSVVDVSLEPLDGDPGHSTDSKARGTLQV